MLVKVISLSNAQNRRKTMSDILNQTDLKWSFLDAVSGADVGLDHPSYDRTQRLKTPGYDMKVNEIACFMSHRKAWAECVQHNEPVLVLEDDVQISADFPLEKINYLIELIISKAPKNSIPRLGHGKIKSETASVLKINEIINFIRCRKDPLGAFSYIVTPDVAKKLLNTSSKFSVPADDFLWRGWENGCFVLDLSREIFFTTDINNPSTIGDRKKPEISLLKKISREFYRAKENKIKNKFEKKLFEELKRGNY